MLMRDHRDTVGVAVIENLTAGTEVRRVVTGDPSELHALANQDVPFGHEIALRDLAFGDIIIGAAIGEFVRPELERCA